MTSVVPPPPPRITRGHNIANWMMDRKWFSFGIILIPTILLAMHIPKIEVFSRFADLLPAKHEYIVNYNRMKQTFGGANVVTMALETTDPSADVFTFDTLKKIVLITEQVDLIAGVNHSRWRVSRTPRFAAFAPPPVGSSSPSRCCPRTCRPSRRP